MPAASIALLAAAALAADSTPAPLVAPLVTPMPAGVTAAGARRAAPAPFAADTQPRRPRAVEMSDGYAARLRVHRWGSYAILPLFAAQYVLGDRLYDQKEALYAVPQRRFAPVDADLRRNHAIVAGAVGAVFVVNTVTGVWNLVESRNVPQGRGRRVLHAVAMLAADAGFVATGVIGSRATDGNLSDARAHRNVAVGSVALATASTLGMWFLGRD